MICPFDYYPFLSPNFNYSELNFEFNTFFNLCEFKPYFVRVYLVVGLGIAIFVM